MVEFQPRAGVEYPRSAGEFRAWFATDADCLDYVDWLRWPNGFVCPHCSHRGGWLMADGRHKCGACGSRIAVTAGTLFDRRRTSLTVWFAACWMFAAQKRGISAKALQRDLGIGSYPTAWSMLHRLRSVLVRPGRDRLSGAVEVDEAFIGGHETGLAGGRARGKKVLVDVAVEVLDPAGFGRARMGILADASSPSLHRFITENIEPGTRVITDGWRGYRGIDSLGYIHEPRSQRAARARGEDPGALLPAVHRVIALAKRWILGTHQGSIGDAHLQAYLDEFVFRFNRRNSSSPGLVFFRVMELAVAHDPVRYDAIVADHVRKEIHPSAPWQRGHPPSLELAAAGRPWRAYPGPVS